MRSKTMQECSLRAPASPGRGHCPERAVRHSWCNAQLEISKVGGRDGHSARLGMDSH